MHPDIDEIIAFVRSQIPDVEVEQMRTVHPIAHDGNWRFRLPGIEKRIEVESPLGACPFRVEHHDGESRSENCECTVETTGHVIVEFLSKIRADQNLSMTKLGWDGTRASPTNKQGAEIDALILGKEIIPAMSRIKKWCGVSLPDARDLFKARYRWLRAERGTEFTCDDEKYWSCYGEDIIDAIAKGW